MITAPPVLTERQRRAACDRLMADTAGLQDTPDDGWEIPPGCTRSDVTEALWRWRARRHRPRWGWVIDHADPLFIGLVAAVWFGVGFMSCYLGMLLGWIR